MNAPIASPSIQRLCWVALYPAGKTQVVVTVTGQQTWARDIDLAELVAVVDRTAALVGLGLYSI
jgi:hypothetical protein